MDNSDVQLVGGPCGQHGPYTFYKAFKYTKNGVKRIVTLSEFFFVKMWRDSDLLCIGELQLLWNDKNSEQVLASLRLYFLPENTPEGRLDHGELFNKVITEKLEKYLRPNRFEVDPNSSSAGEDWTHWKRTFKHFLDARKETEKFSEEMKLQILVNHISPNVYTIISECKDYETALEKLDAIYIKPKNKIYARHRLATRRQENESIDQYIQILQQLAKDCDFKSVSSEQNKNDYIRDAFIAGLRSAPVRQRLLENTSLELEEAYNQARSLEMAQLHSARFSMPISSTNVAASIESSETDDHPRQSENVTAIAKQQSDFRTCYFCGDQLHPRLQCPAANVTCKFCFKRGHFAKVCRSKKTNTRTVAATTELLANSLSAFASVCLQKATVVVKVNGIRAHCLIDTGSTSSFISSSFVDRCKTQRIPSNELPGTSSAPESIMHVTAPHSEELMNRRSERTRRSPRYLDNYYRF